jgi:hypothetical protein
VFTIHHADGCLIALAVFQVVSSQVLSIAHNGWIHFTIRPLNG